jgi:arylsulfatase B
MILFLALCLPVGFLSAQVSSPNILLVIADDLGVDPLNGYHTQTLMPATPTLDSLRSIGLTFTNAFAYPVCSPTRAAIMSGKYGIKNGVTRVPANLDTVHTSLFQALSLQTQDQYASALVGKWHLSNPIDLDHPAQHGVDHYMGVMAGAVSDYYVWDRTENGATTVDSSYATTAFTDEAIGWINAQTQPWFLWLAHVSPHTPFHEPPSHMHTLQNLSNPYRQYLAMIETIDFELNRLLAAMPAAERENTLVIFVGDNGTPGQVMRDYPIGHGKGSVYQGGVRVPLIVAGANVSRQNERDPALVHVVDLYATILEITGADLPGGLYNSLSFQHLFNDEPGPTRDYNYSELRDNDDDFFAIRGPRYKLIEDLNAGTQEFYDLLVDSLELTNLMDLGLTQEQQTIKADLEAEAQQIRTSWSCRDHIQNGDETGIDCGGSNCEPCSATSVESQLPPQRVQVFPNPARDVLYVDAGEERIEAIRVSNLMGEWVLSQEVGGSTQTTVELGSLPPQILLVEIKLPQRVEVVKVARH